MVYAVGFNNSIEPSLGTITLNCEYQSRKLEIECEVMESLQYDMNVPESFVKEHGLQVSGVEHGLQSSGDVHTIEKMIPIKKDGKSVIHAANEFTERTPR